MTIYLSIRRSAARSVRKGFTLVEPVIGLAILVLLIVAFYAALSQAIFTMRMAREHQRATQILMQKMETVRLYKWNQINNGFIPAKFTSTYDPDGATPGVTYEGTLSVAAASIDAPYSNNLKMITVDLRWITAGVERHRQMRTLISEWGLNNYVAD